VTGPASRSTQWSPLWDEPTSLDRIADPETYKTVNNNPACFHIDIESIAFATADAPSSNCTQSKAFLFDLSLCKFFVLLSVSKVRCSLRPPYGEFRQLAYYAFSGRLGDVVAREYASEDKKCFFLQSEKSNAERYATSTEGGAFEWLQCPFNNGS